MGRWGRRGVACEQASPSERAGKPVRRLGGEVSVEVS